MITSFYKKQLFQGVDITMRMSFCPLCGAAIICLRIELFPKRK